ncbi:hypothetical protein CIPAW_07G019900 [Carya illinoinensis]|uniref:Uncharacterized protein n=1 Tax=Carya illinoinensis TaxID=32201 RepID=A0A8T1PWN0_CARIL|nr:hypothetical protein CIPAW_07G019900 [Carya illinoinensis]
MREMNMNGSEMGCGGTTNGTAISLPPYLMWC